MAISARNTLNGTVKEIKRGMVTATVKVDVGGGNVITSSITLEAADELGLAEGKPVNVVIKASDVMLATD
jgi:molybdopterin-binding protein